MTTKFVGLFAETEKFPKEKGEGKQPFACERCQSGVRGRTGGRTTGYRPTGNTKYSARLARAVGAVRPRMYNTRWALLLTGKYGLTAYRQFFAISRSYEMCSEMDHNEVRFQVTTPLGRLLSFMKTLLPFYPEERTASPLNTHTHLSKQTVPYLRKQ